MNRPLKLKPGNALRTRNRIRKAQKPKISKKAKDSVDSFVKSASVDMGYMPETYQHDAAVPHRFGSLGAYPDSTYLQGATGYASPMTTPIDHPAYLFTSNNVVLRNVPVYNNATLDTNNANSNDFAFL
eukprot:Nk52_evm40s32 gene=Nk52_evmTU40s32